MKVIGFATEFYTLWDVDSQPTFFTDSYGSHHQTGTKTNYYYIQNISTDLDKVKALYPTTPIDEELRGKSRSFSTIKEEDLTPHILKFGKYCGKSIQEVSEKDFGYILWLIENGKPATIKVCMELPSVVSYFEKLKIEWNEKINSYPVIENGISEITFQTNPNRIGKELIFIRNNSKKLGEIPSTLKWETINQYTDKREDWFLLEKATSEYGALRILRYTDCNGVVTPFHFSGNNFDTIEDAKIAAEIQVLTNQNKLDGFYQPTEFAPFINKFYAIASVGEGNTIYVFFDQIKGVNGMYPYNMGVINGKAMKLKNKTIKLNLNIFHTEKSEFGCVQYATINN